MRRVRCFLALSLLWLVIGSPARAWEGDGHALLARTAVQALPEEMPAFFRGGADMIAHCSFDPDVAKNPAAPALRERESPDHYLDMELVRQRPLPLTRYRFVELCTREKVEARSVGFVPYTVAEGTERLAIAFAEHRQWPQNPHIQAKCLVYAGLLAHYAQDLCQPLHLTVHHDGRVGPEGRSPRTGIHARMDYLIQKLNPDPAALAQGLKVEAIEPLMPGVFARMDAIFALVDRVYALEAALPPATEAEWQPTPEVAAFGRERAREAARFTAALYLTAWRKSAAIQLPEWLKR